MCKSWKRKWTHIFHLSGLQQFLFFANVCKQQLYQRFHYFCWVQSTQTRVNNKAPKHFSYFLYSHLIIMRGRFANMKCAHAEICNNNIQAMFNVRNIDKAVHRTLPRKIWNKIIATHFLSTRNLFLEHFESFIVVWSMQFNILKYFFLENSKGLPTLKVENMIFFLNKSSLWMDSEHIFKITRMDFTPKSDSLII